MADQKQFKDVQDERQKQSHAPAEERGPMVAAEFTALMTLKAQMLAYHTVFIVAAVIVAIGAIVALFTFNVTEKKSGVEVFVE